MLEADVGVVEMHRDLAHASMCRRVFDFGFDQGIDDCIVARVPRDSVVVRPEQGRDRDSGVNAARQVPREEDGVEDFAAAAFPPFFAGFMIVQSWNRLP